MIMGQPESRLSRRIMHHLRSQGVFVFKQHGSEFTMAGLPDLIACVDGLFVGFEVKMPDKRHNTSVTQDLVLSMIRQSKGLTFVICSAYEALGIVSKIRDCLRDCEYYEMIGDMHDMLDVD